MVRMKFAIGVLAALTLACGGLDESALVPVEAPPPSAKPSPAPAASLSKEWTEVRVSARGGLEIYEPCDQSTPSISYTTHRGEELSFNLGAAAEGFSIQKLKATPTGFQIRGKAQDSEGNPTGEVEVVKVSWVDQDKGIAEWDSRALKGLFVAHEQRATLPVVRQPPEACR